MAVSLSPLYVTDSWTELPNNTASEATSTQLQVLLLNILQVLELHCNSSFALQSEFQEAKRLISDMNILNAEMEKRLQDTCESDQKIDTETVALKEQLASMETQLEVLTEDKRHLQCLVTSKEANLTAALKEKEKLERLVQTLQMELAAGKKENNASNRMFESDEDAIPESTELLFQNITPHNCHQKEIMQHMKLSQPHAQCLAEKTKLEQLNNNLKEQEAALSEHMYFLEATLNISAFNNSILEEKLQKAKETIERFRSLEQEFRYTLMAQKMINFTQFVIRSCSCPTTNNLNAITMALQNALTTHNNIIMTLLMTQNGSRREINFHVLREVLRGRTREHALIEDSKEGEVVRVTALLNSHVDPNICDEQGFSPLQWSALKGHTAVAEVLLQHGGIVDVDQRLKDCVEVTPLHLAALAGHTQIVQLLLELGADVNASTRDGSTPLHLAVKEGHLNVVEILLSYGANTNLRNFKGLSPKDLAVANKFRTIESRLCE